MRTLEVNSRTGNVAGKKVAQAKCLVIRRNRSVECRVFSDESGQVLPWVLLLLLLFLGMSALVVDVGFAYSVQRQLQASADAAALAGAATLPETNYATVAQTYSSSSSGKNIYGGLTVVPAVSGLCLTTVSGWGLSCDSTHPNAVQVTETATIPTFFAGVMGIKNMTVSATSTASKGSKPKPYNVAIVLDTTPSMADTDPYCSNKTQLQCANQAFQQLLQGLDPSLDRISLFTFPNLTTTTVSNDYTCGASAPTAGPYTFPSTTATTLSPMPYSVTTTTTTGTYPHQHTTTTTTTVQETYQVTGGNNTPGSQGYNGYWTDYRTSDTAKTLNTNSNLTNAIGGTSCTGLQTGYENTYYAGAIYAAQSSLVAEQAANPGSQNAMIILSDGNATAKEQYPTSSFTEGGQQYAAGDFYAGVNDMVTGSQSTTIATNSGNYPSWVGECGQGIDAANAATAAGTTVYVIGYNSPTTSNSSNCGSDRSGGTHQNVAPCDALKQMSSGWASGDTSHFYSDFYGPTGNSGCSAAGASESITALNGIVNAILGQMSGARLIPNNTP